jgi:phospholipid/cholesterol/gamma-HCH transport system ATP-binding protein
MRTAEYMGVLCRSNLVKFASKEDMLATDNPIIQQFLAGRPEGPIGMDEMADAGATPAATSRATRRPRAPANRR